MYFSGSPGGGQRSNNALNVHETCIKVYFCGKSVHFSRDYIFRRYWGYFGIIPE